MNGDNNAETQNAMTKPNEDENTEASISKPKNSDLVDNEAKPEGAELFEKLSPRDKEGFFGEAIMAMQHFSGSASSAISSKINEKHIDKILDITEKNENNIFKDSQSSRKFTLIYVLIGAIVFIFLTLFLVGKDVELFKEIIKLLIAFVGGIGTGYGIKAAKDKN